MFFRPLLLLLLLPLVGAADPSTWKPLPFSGAFGFVEGSKSGATVRVPPCFEEARPFSDGLAAVQLFDRWGYINQTGRFVIPPRYVEAFDFSEGRAVVLTDGDGYKLIDQRGQLQLGGPAFLLPGPELDSALCKNGRVLVMDPDTYDYGFLGKDGKWAIRPRYGSADAFSEGLAAVLTREGKVRWITPNGIELPRLESDFREPLSRYRFAEGKTCQLKSGRFGFVDRTGKVAGVRNFEDAWGYRHGFAKVRKPTTHEGRYYYIDAKGKSIVLSGLLQPESHPGGILSPRKILDPRNLLNRGKAPEFLIHWRDGTPAMSLQEVSEIQINPDRSIWVRGLRIHQTLLLSPNGKVLWRTPTPAVDREAMTDDLELGLGAGLLPMPLPTKGRMGVLSTNGTWVVEGAVEELTVSASGLIRARHVQRTQGFDATGRPFARRREVWPGGTLDGEMLVIHIADGRWGYSTVDQPELIPARFDLAYPFRNGLAKVLLDGQFGLIDPQGAWVVKPSYIGLGDAHHGFVRAKTRAGWGVLSLKGGGWLVPPKYVAARDFANGLAWVHDGASWLAIDRTGNIVWNRDSILHHMQRGIPAALHERFIPKGTPPLITMVEETPRGFREKSMKPRVSENFGVLTVCPGRNGPAFSIYLGAYEYFIQGKQIQQKYTTPSAFGAPTTFSESGLAVVKIPATPAEMDKVLKDLEQLEADVEKGDLSALSRLNLGRAFNHWSTFNFMRPDGTLLSNRRYVDAKEFSEGLAAVQDEKGWSYIREDGRQAFRVTGKGTPMPFEGGRAIIDARVSAQVIDRTGAVILRSVKPEAAAGDKEAALMRLLGSGPLEQVGHFILEHREDNVVVYNNTGRELLKIQHPQIEVEEKKPGRIF